MKPPYSNLLNQVVKPARYTGGEWNSVTHDWDSARLRMALAFPDIYEVGMSNMAIPILYEQLNSVSGVLAERVYAPWPDMESSLRENGWRLRGLESGRPLGDFDAIGFSLGYELSYTTVLNMLDLAGIPVFSRDRGQHHPLIIAGGSSASNPEPMSDFIDVFFIGEAEQALKTMVEVIIACKQDRPGQLRALSQLPGIYVPVYYDVDYGGDGEVSRFVSNVAWAPAAVDRVVASRLAPVARPPVPYIEVIHDRAAVEIQRGCSRGCRFCQAGVLYRPVRELPEADVLQAADKLLKNCGYNTLSLVSLSSGDYSTISHLVDALSGKYSGDGITISLPSLRLDKSSIQLIESLPYGRKTTLTFAPEAGSVRLRNAINKSIPEDTLMETFAAAFEKEWMNLKLYFMVGLPTETLDDVKAIADLASSACKTGKRIRGRPPRVRVTVSSFVPKPHTPCQWSAQDHAESLTEKQALLQQEMRRSGAQLSWHDTRISLLEAVLSRGDRRLGQVIYTAWRKGCRLDTWSEFFDFAKWQESFNECGINLSFYAHRERDINEHLPWQHIRSGISPGFLKAERRKMLVSDITDDCRHGECNRCGLHKSHPDCGARDGDSNKSKFDFEDETG